MITIEACDPRDSRATFCLRAYFDELARRFDHGFEKRLT